MGDGIDRSLLRTPAPTLEPDDDFVARLSRLAASSAPSAAGPARSSAPAGWQVLLTAASVAAVLVGVAWLAGLRPGEEIAPADQPTPAPSRTSDPPGGAADGADRSTGSPAAGVRGGSSPSGEGRGNGHRGAGDHAQAPAGVAGQPVGPAPAVGTGAGHGGPAGHGGGAGDGSGDGSGDERGDSAAHSQGQQHADARAGDHPSGRGDRDPGHDVAPDRARRPSLDVRLGDHLLPPTNRPDPRPETRTDRQG